MNRGRSAVRDETAGSSVGGSRAAFGLRNVINDRVGDQRRGSRGRAKSWRGGLDVLQLDADEPASRLSTPGWGQFSSITRSKHDEEPNDSAPPEWMAHVAETTPSRSHFSGSRMGQRPHVLNDLFRASSSSMRRTAPAALPTYGHRGEGQHRALSSLPSRTFKCAVADLSESHSIYAKSEALSHCTS